MKTKSVVFRNIFNVVLACIGAVCSRSTFDLDMTGAMVYFLVLIKLYEYIDEIVDEIAASKKDDGDEQPPSGTAPVAKFN